MTTELMTRDQRSEIMERVILAGDLSKLQSGERVSYYQAVCESVGLNPLTRPFSYMQLSGKLVLYASKDCTEQLRKMHKVSIVKLERDKLDGVYIVTAYATTPDGRNDSSTGAVNIEGVKGDALANAVMKAETKAKRRVTLSICGLGFLDETELETTPAIRLEVDNTGSLIPAQTVETSNVAKQGSEHAITTIQQPQAAQDKKPDKALPKLAALRHKPFITWAQEWTVKHPEYRKNDNPDINHVMARVARLGFSEVTEANVGDVQAALDAYVRGKVDPATESA